MPILNSIFAYTMDSPVTILSSSPSPSPSPSSIATITATTYNALITTSNQETRRDPPPLPMHLNYTTQETKRDTPLLPMLNHTTKETKRDTPSLPMQLNYTTLSSLSSSSSSLATEVVSSDGEGGGTGGGGGGGGQLEVHEVACECCGLVLEECTPGYIEHVRELHCGYWVCGLCSEAVKEKRRRMGRSLKEALYAHRADCLRFEQEERSKPVLCLGDAMRQILRRNLSSPCSRLRPSRSLNKRLNQGSSNPNPNPNLDCNKNLTRSTSCLNPQLRDYE